MLSIVGAVSVNNTKPIVKYINNASTLKLTNAGRYSVDYYLTITESKRRMNGDGFTYEKHKIFLYKEDFFKFVTALNETVDHLKEELMPEVDFTQFEREDTESEFNDELKWE